MPCASARVALIGGPGGARPPSSKKTVCKGGPGGLLKLAKSLIVSEHLNFQAEALKLEGVKGLQGGREHSSDFIIEQIFSNFFFRQTSNLFSPNSCILPINTIKTSRVNCYIFCMFFFAAWWAVPYRGISEVRLPRSEKGGHS